MQFGKINVIIELTKKIFKETNMLDNLNLPAEVAEILENYLFVALLSVIIVLGIMAYHGFWLFKKCLPISGALAFGAVGSLVVTPMLDDMVGNMIPEAISLAAIIGFVCAIVGALLMTYAFKLSIFLLGAGAGAGVGLIVSALLKGTIEFFATQIGALVAVGVCALVVAILTALLFRPLFIIVTSVLGLAAAGACVGLAVMPEGNLIVLGVCAAIGFIVGIFAAKKQFRASGKDAIDED